MKYVVTYQSNQQSITTIPNKLGAARSINGIFPVTKDGYEAYLIYINHFVTGARLIKSGDASIYTFESESPVSLPFKQNLNYVDFENATILDLDKLHYYISRFKDVDEGHIINTAEPHKSTWIKALTSIMLTLGHTIYKSDSDYQESEMESQVICTKPVTMERLSDDDAEAVLEFDVNNPLLPGTTNRHGQQVDDEEDEGEFGYGGDWWKESIEKLSKIIAEDPDQIN